jgi:hypothetical protein
MFLLQGVALLVISAAVRRLLNQSARGALWLTRLQHAVEGMLFLHIAWLNLRLLNHLSMMLPFSYADDLLHGWDQALKLDWPAYFEMVFSHPPLFEMFNAAYTSLTFLSIVVLLLLISFGYIKRAQDFIDTFLVTAVICIVIGAVFPAKAAVLSLIPDLSIFAQIGWIPGAYHMPYLEALRGSSTPLTLDPAQLPGLVTFPSFHTAAGILIIAACRKTCLSTPSLIYSGVMIAATPVFGGHYFVDLLAGTAIAVIVVGVIQHFNRKGGASARPRPAPTSVPV